MEGSDLTVVSSLTEDENDETITVSLEDVVVAQSPELRGSKFQVVSQEIQDCKPLKRKLSHDEVEDSISSTSFSKRIKVVANANVLRRTESHPRSAFAVSDQSGVFLRSNLPSPSERIIGGDELAQGEFVAQNLLVNAPNVYPICERIEPSYKCSKCDVVSTSFEVFQHHLQSHQKSTSYNKKSNGNVAVPCDFCPSIFTSAEEFALHIKSVHLSGASSDSHFEEPSQPLAETVSFSVNNDVHTEPVESSLSADFMTVAQDELGNLLLVAESNIAVAQNREVNSIFPENVDFFQDAETGLLYSISSESNLQNSTLITPHTAVNNAAFDTQTLTNSNNACSISFMDGPLTVVDSENNLFRNQAATTVVDTLSNLTKSVAKETGLHNAARFEDGRGDSSLRIDDSELQNLFPVKDRQEIPEPTVVENIGCGVNYVHPIYFCGTCQFNTDSIVKISQHIVATHPLSANPPIKPNSIKSGLKRCAFCSFTYKVIHRLTVHLMRRHKPTTSKTNQSESASLNKIVSDPRSCTLCGFFAQKSSAMFRHLLQAHKLVVFTNEFGKEYVVDAARWWSLQEQYQNAQRPALQVELKSVMTKVLESLPATSVMRRHSVSDQQISTSDDDVMILNVNLEEAKPSSTPNSIMEPNFSNEPITNGSAPKVLSRASGSRSRPPSQSLSPVAISAQARVTVSEKSGSKKATAAKGSFSPVTIIPASSGSKSKKGAVVNRDVGKPSVLSRMAPRSITILEDSSSNAKSVGGAGQTNAQVASSTPNIQRQAATTGSLVYHSVSTESAEPEPWLDASRALEANLELPSNLPVANDQFVYLQLSNGDIGKISTADFLQLQQQASCPERTSVGSIRLNQNQNDDVNYKVFEEFYQTDSSSSSSLIVQGVDGIVGVDERVTFNEPLGAPDASIGAQLVDIDGQLFQIQVP